MSLAIETSAATAKKTSLSLFVREEPLSGQTHQSRAATQRGALVPVLVRRHAL